MSMVELSLGDAAVPAEVHVALSVSLERHGALLVGDALPVLVGRAPSAAERAEAAWKEGGRLSGWIRHLPLGILPRSSVTLSFEVIRLGDFRASCGLFMAPVTR